MAQIKKVRELKPRFRIIEKFENKKNVSNASSGNGGKVIGGMKEASGGSSEESLSDVVSGGARGRGVVRSAPTQAGEGVRVSPTENSAGSGGAAGERTQFYTARGGATDTTNKYSPAKMQQSFLQSVESQGQFFRQRNILHQHDLNSPSVNSEGEKKYYEMEKKKPEAEERRRRPWWV